MGEVVAELRIEGIDADVMERLAARAKLRGRSIETEAEMILRQALVGGESAADLARRIQARFADMGGLDIDLPEREPLGDPPKLD